MLRYAVDIKPIAEEIGASVEIDDTLDMTELVVGDETFTLREPASFKVAVTNAGAGIVAHGAISAPVRTRCSRCLCDFDDVIEGEVVGFFMRSGDEGADEEDVEHVDAEGIIDIGPSLLAALVIEAPFAPLHDEECQGLCPECGADLNEGPCGCGSGPDEDHPFAVLRDLMPAEDEPKNI